MSEILDADGAVMAFIEVEEYSPGKFEGRVVSSNFPDRLTYLLKEFEARVESLVLSCLDELGREIAEYDFRLSLNNKKIFDLQVMQGNLISFQT